MATDVLARIAVGFAVDSPLLYSRVDLVSLDDGKDVILEVELAEPSFFLSVAPDAARRFVSAVLEHVALAPKRKGDH
jgi:hypothetical protein